MPSPVMYYYRPNNDALFFLIRIPLDVAFHSLGSEGAEGKGWAAPYALFLEQSLQIMDGFFLSFFFFLF